MREEKTFRVVVFRFETDGFTPQILFVHKKMISLRCRPQITTGYYL